MDRRFCKANCNNDRISAKDAAKFPVSINVAFTDAKEEIVKHLQNELTEKMDSLEEEYDQLSEYLGVETKPDEKKEPAAIPLISLKKAKKDFDM
jgi:hypothetical protein